jgi:hypothetical protein
MLGLLAVPRLRPKAAATFQPRFLHFIRSSKIGSGSTASVRPFTTCEMATMASADCQCPIAASLDAASLAAENTGSPGVIHVTFAPYTRRIYAIASV